MLQPQLGPERRGWFKSSGQATSSAMHQAGDIGCSSVVTARSGKVSAVGLLLGVSFSQLRAGAWGSLRADLGQFRTWAESGSALCVPAFHYWFICGHSIK